MKVSQVLEHLDKLPQPIDFQWPGVLAYVHGAKGFDQWTRIEEKKNGRKDH